MTTADEAIITFDAMVADIYRTLQDKMALTEQYVEDEAKGTYTYKDVTGANRAGTVAFRRAGTDDTSAKLDSAAAAAESLHPGFSDDSGDPGPVSSFDVGIWDVIATSATNYSLFLNIRDGGASMYLADAILNGSYAAFQDLQGEIDAVIATHNVP